VLADDVLARHPEVRAPAVQRHDDLGCGDEGDVDAFEALDLAAIAALRPDLAQGQPRLGEEIRRLLHQAPLGGHGECQARAHACAPRTTVSRRSVWMAPPTAGTSRGAPTALMRPS